MKLSKKEETRLSLLQQKQWLVKIFKMQQREEICKLIHDKQDQSSMFVFY